MVIKNFKGLNFFNVFFYPLRRRTEINKGNNASFFQWSIPTIISWNKRKKRVMGTIDTGGQKAVSTTIMKVTNVSNHNGLLILRNSKNLTAIEMARIEI